MSSPTVPPIPALVALFAPTLSTLTPVSRTALQTLVLTEVSATTCLVLAVALAQATPVPRAPLVSSVLFAFVNAGILQPFLFRSH